MEWTPAVGTAGARGGSKIKEKALKMHCPLIQGGLNMASCATLARAAASRPEFCPMIPINNHTHSNAVDPTGQTLTVHLQLIDRRAAARG